MKEIIARIAFLLCVGFARSSILTETYQDRVDIGGLNENEEEATATKACALNFASVVSDPSFFDAVTFSIHRNGEPDACGSALSSVEIIDKALKHIWTGDCHAKIDEYEFESFLTELFSKSLEATGCGSTDDKKATPGLLGFCDMGSERTVPQPDSADLVPVALGSLPCRFFTREGVRISSFDQLGSLVQSAKDFSEDDCASNENEETCSAGAVNLYAVPAGRMFMFAPKYIGEMFHLAHVLDKKGNPLSLEVISVDPRVFDIHNFFSEDEAQALIDKALSETSETHKLHRSTTGTVGASVFNKRTSENAWDTHGQLAMTIKRRCMRALGFDRYYESHTDGLQVLRYNLTTAYTSHMDYLDNARSEAYDYDTSGRGGNRFATILLYMSDLDDNAGGETVFTDAWPMGIKKKVHLRDEIRRLRSSGEIEMLKKGSWEEEMTAMCRTRLSVKPSKSRAVLFYSQFPNGKQDPMSRHGGCPVLNGTKWAANLWVWSAARREFDHAPFKFDPAKEKVQVGGHVAVTAVFRNTGKNPKFNEGQLYYDESGFFGNLGPGQSVRVNTYVGHVWNVKNSKGEILHTWHITNAHAKKEDMEFLL